MVDVVVLVVVAYMIDQIRNVDIDHHLHLNEEKNNFSEMLQSLVFLMFQDMVEVDDDMVLVVDIDHKVLDGPQS